MIERTFSAHELALVRRCFAAGEPDREMLADSDFLFDQAIHASTGLCLSQAEAGKPVHFSDGAWNRLVASCAMGVEILYDELDDRLTNEDYDILMRITDGPPEEPRNGFV